MRYQIEWNDYSVSSSKCIRRDKRSVVMRIVSRLIQASRDPIVAGVWVLGRICPSILHSRVSRLAFRQGITEFKFVLSFDCDTEKDIRVVEDVHEQLRTIGVTPVYAVPGELLEKGSEVYRRIAATGAEFINHGYRTHSHIDPVTGNYISSFFYDEIPREILLEDIRRGHAAIKTVLNRTPKGFRVPHFGSFQRNSDLTYLYAQLRRLGYQYSTSTTPLKAILRGPVQLITDGFWELPVSGCYSTPLSILDSFGFRIAPVRNVTEADYVKEFRLLAGYYLAGNRPGLMNIYADPSQVYDWPEFFKCIGLVANASVASYEHLLREVGGRRHAPPMASLP